MSGLALKHRLPHSAKPHPRILPQRGITMEKYNSPDSGNDFGSGKNLKSGRNAETGKTLKSEKDSESERVSESGNNAAARKNKGSGEENLRYVMDVGPQSIWLRTTPGALVLQQPFYCTEAGHFMARPHFSTARSKKESYLLFYTAAGTGFVKQGKSEVRMNPGDALLIDCRIPQSYGTAPGFDAWDHYWMHIDGSGLKAMFNILSDSPDAEKLSPVSMPGINLASSFESIFRSMQQSDTESTVETGLSVHRILARMAEEKLAHNGAAPDTRERILETADYIRAHCGEEITIDDLLTRTHFSKSYLMSQFRQYIGTTPHSFLVNCRITEAKKLLSLSDLTVGEIAHEVGFQDESHFSARFSSLTGQSPLQYRKCTIRQA